MKEAFTRYVDQSGVYLAGSFAHRLTLKKGGASRTPDP